MQKSFSCGDEKALKRRGVALDNAALTSAGLRHIIHIQGIVRARMAAKSLKKRVKTHLIRTKVAAELLSTERSYFKDLLVIVDEFYMPLSTELTKEQLETLFSNIKEIIAVHARFIDILDRRVKNWGYHACIADTVINFVNDFQVYETYINNFSKASELLQALLEEGSAAAKLINNKTKNVKACRGLKLSAFLIMPIQRLPRIILLLKTWYNTAQELIKYTPMEHPDMSHCKEAHAKMSEVAERLNTSRRLAEHREKFRVITKVVSGLQMQEAANREFIHEGELEEITVNKSSLRSKLSSSASFEIEKVSFYVFMFSDVLLLAKRLSAPARVVKNLGKDSTYQFSTPSIITLYPSTRARIDKAADHSFVIENTDPHEDAIEVHVFVAASDEARDMWLKKINTRALTHHAGE